MSSHTQSNIIILSKLARRPGAHGFFSYSGDAGAAFGKFISVHIAPRWPVWVQDSVAEPVPGLIAGGPNKNWPYAATKEKLGADTPPAKYYLDETPSADTNEIAIYWNSPAVFVFAFFRTQGGMNAEKRREEK